MRTKEQRLQLYKAKLERRGPELVKLIKEGWRSIQTTSLQVGMWLLEFRDGEYWKKHHTTFNEARDELFGISERYGQFLIKGAETVKSLPPSLQAEITTESQARALSVAPPEQRAKIVEKLSKNGGVTAEKIEDIVSRIAQKTEPQRNVTKQVTNPNNCSGRDLVNTESEMGSKPKTSIPKKDKKVFYDVPGIPIPDDALKWWEEAWDDKEEEHKDVPKVQDILTQISKLKSIVVGGREKGELRWLKVTNSIADTFDSLRSLISEAKPYAVCTTCQGVPSLQKEGCNFCKSTGLISKWQWETQSRQEVKDIVLRRAADLKKERENVH